MDLRFGQSVKANCMTVSGRLAVAMISPRVVRSASVAGRIFVERDIVSGFLSSLVDLIS